MGAVEMVDDGRSEIAPHRQQYGPLGGFADLEHRLARPPDDIETRERRETKPQCRRTQVVVSAADGLHNEPDAAIALEVEVRCARTHPGAARQLFQREWATGLFQALQQLV